MPLFYVDHIYDLEAASKLLDCCHGMYHNPACARQCSNRVGKIIFDARASIAFNGSYPCYPDEYSPHFIKKESDELYLLTICVDVDGERRINEIRNKFKIPGGRYSNSLIIKLSIVDGWWFNLCPQKIFGEVLPPYTEEEWAEFRRKFNDIRDDVEVPVDTFQEASVIMTISLWQDVYIIKSGNTRQYGSYQRIEGSRIVGPSWRGHRKKGQGADPEEAILQVRVQFKEDWFHRLPVFTPEKIEFLDKATEAIAAKIKIGPTQ